MVENHLTLHTKSHIYSVYMGLIQGRVLVLPQLLKTFKIPQFINLHAKTASSTVRTSFNRFCGPIRCAESNGVVCLAVRALVLEIWWKTCPILRFLKPPSTDSFFYCQNIVQVGRWTYPML